MRDIYHNIAIVQPLNTVVATTTKTSTTIDIQSFESLMVLFSLGIAGDTLSGSIYWTLKLQHSDDDSTYADVPAASLLNGANSIVIDSLTKDETAVLFGYSGGKRYVKAVATPTGTHANGTPMSVIALKGTANRKPVI